jgi:hypothetical protein
MLRYIGVYFAGMLLITWLVLGSNIVLMIREKLMTIVEAMGG